MPFPARPNTRLCLLFAALTVAAGAPGAALAKDGGKKPKFDTKRLTDAALTRRLRIPRSSIGYLVIDARTGEVVASKQPTDLFTPASAIKVPTTVAALGILGGDYRFRTQLLATGRVENGVLKGDVILRGGGDPVLTTDDYKGFVAALNAAGIKRISGRFLYDSSLYPATPYIARTHAHTVAYNPGIAALSLNFNRVKLKWTRGKEPDSLDAAAYSKTDNIEIKVDFLTFGMARKRQDAPHGLILHKNGEGYKWLLIQRARRKGEMWLPVKRAAYHAAHVFQKFAGQNGILLPEPRPGAAPRTARVIHTHRSDPLPRIVHKVLRYSNNMAAEMVGLAAANRLARFPLSIRASSVLLAKWLQAKAPESSWSGYDVHNHSGLSKDTRVSPAQMVSILKFAANQRYGRESYGDLLRPYFVGGGRRERGFPKHIKVLAKTGTINYVRALAGYLTARSKRRLIFALFISDYRAREIAARKKLKHKPLWPRRWLGRTRQLQRGIVRRWALEF